MATMRAALSAGQWQQRQLGQAFVAHHVAQTIGAQNERRLHGKFIDFSVRPAIHAQARVTSGCPAPTRRLRGVSRPRSICSCSQNGRA